MYAPISFDGVTAQWGIGSATNYDVFTAVARHMIYILVAVGIIGILLLLAALISFVTKRISTPMSDLQGVMENFARLDLRADNPANVRARIHLGCGAEPIRTRRGECCDNRRGQRVRGDTVECA